MVVGAIVVVVVVVVDDVVDGGRVDVAVEVDDEAAVPTTAVDDGIEVSSAPAPEPASRPTEQLAAAARRHSRRARRRTARAYRRCPTGLEPLDIPTFVLAEPGRPPAPHPLPAVDHRRPISTIGRWTSHRRSEPPPAAGCTPRAITESSRVTERNAPSTWATGSTHRSLQRRWRSLLRPAIERGDDRDRRASVIELAPGERRSVSV